MQWQSHSYACCIRISFRRTILINTSRRRLMRFREKKKKKMLQNFVNALRLARKFSSTLSLGWNVIFPTVLIARDVISNSRQSAEIYRRYLTWLRFIVHRVVRRGVICDHNSPLNVALDACAEFCLFFSLFPSPLRVPPVSRRDPAFPSLPRGQ